VEAVHQVHLTVREGEIVTVIGPNGAGKTTLLARPWACCPRGRADLDGERIAGRRRGHGGARRGPGARKARAVRRDVGRGQPAAGRLSRWRKGQRDQAQRMDEVFASSRA
jgi:branched-chain amino acid transport system ATP-binding protein